MPEQDRIEALIQDHLAGRLDAAGSAELSAWLHADRTHRVGFMQAVRFHEELAHLATEQARRRAPDAAVLRSGLGRSARRRRQSPQARRWWRLAVPALLAASLLFALGLWAWPAPAAQVSLASGSAQLSDGGRMSAGAGVAVGTQLTMVEQGRLVWKDGSQVTLAAGSRIACSESGVELHDGRLMAAVQPRAAGTPFAVTTAHARVIVLGTRFAVAAAGETTVVEVESGRVRVSAGAQERVLGPGETVRAGTAGLRGRTLQVVAAGAPAGAYGSVVQAMADAQPGDTVLLQPGLHRCGDGTATLRLARSGAPDAPIILRGLPGAEFHSDSWNAISIEDAAWVEIRGLRLSYQGSERSGMSGNGIAILRSRHITIAGCEIVGFGGDGVNSRDTDHLLIEGNRIERCGGGRLGVMGGITIRPPVAYDAAEGYHITVLRNRIHQATVNAPNHQTPERWTGGHGILVFSDLVQPAEHRILLAGNLITASGGSGISIYQAAGVDVRGNLIHGSGRQPRHPGGELHIYGRTCTASGNLIVPSDGRRVWILRPQDQVDRQGNLVWERDGVARPEVPAVERLPASPFLVPAVDEAGRSDFRLRPGLQAGPDFL